MYLKFRFDAEVPGKARPRMTRTGRAYTPTATREAELYFSEAMRGTDTYLEGPLKADVLIFTQRPKSHYRANGMLGSKATAFPTKKPDADNQMKLLFDAAMKAEVIQDDSQIVQVTYDRQWGSDAYCVLTFTELSC